MTFDSDAFLDVRVSGYEAENPVELEFSVIKETALDGETGETLQNPECDKSYWCKATVGGKVYASDVVKVEHDIVIDEYVAPTRTETGLTEGSHCTRCEDMTVEQEVIPDLGGHIDADGDYLCDNDCGHEFEKPVTPDEPAEDTCDRCGEVHTNFFQNFICMIRDFFNRIISFFTGLFK